jgi:aryl-alcohol dehydrogenase-like predicted oxidoreductase
MAGSERIGGRATPEGTKRFADRFPALPQHFRRPDRLWLSSLGLGTKPGAPGGVDDLCYRSVVPRALELGTNVFDTSISYRQQTSERALGRALARAFREGVAARDEVFVISKCGYLSPDAESVMDGRRYLLRTYVESGLVDLADVTNGVHVLTPRFVADQVERSRDNLGLDTIDLYLLEDPELLLAARGPSDFKKELARLFETLESAVARGAIASYGLSTWHGLLVPYGERGHLSMFELLETAIDVGGAEHHLRGVALPYSVALGEAKGLASQFGPEARPANLFETLRDTGTAVFTAAPLVHGRAARGMPLFFRQAFPGLASDAQRCLQFARSTPGVTTALVAMRSPEHVDENLALASRVPAPAEAIDKLFETARKRAARA